MELKARLRELSEQVILQDISDNMESFILDKSMSVLNSHINLRASGISQNRRVVNKFSNKVNILKSENDLGRLETNRKDFLTDTSIDMGPEKMKYIKNRNNKIRQSAKTDMPLKRRGVGKSRPKRGRKKLDDEGSLVDRDSLRNINKFNTGFFNSKRSDDGKLSFLELLIDQLLL